MTDETEKERMLDHYNRDEPDASSRVSLRADQWDGKEAFVEKMQSEADSIRQKGECQDIAVEFGETKNHETHYYHAEFSAILSTGVEGAWLANQMQSVCRGVEQ